MKKLISALICTAMLLSLMTPAFAEVVISEKVTEYTTEEIKALNLESELINVYSKSGWSVTPLTTETPVKYMFKVDGTTDAKTYTLLKSVNAEEGDGYFVIVADTNVLTSGSNSAAYALRSAGYKGISSTDIESKTVSKQFNVDDQGSIAYYLNQDSYIDTHFNDMKDYIQTHKWYVEHTNIPTNAYTTKSKLALISLTELTANADRIGALNRSTGYSPERVLTRTPHLTENAQNYSAGISGGSYSAPTVWVYTCTTEGAWNLGGATIPYHWECAERPCFYLSEDFFTSVKLDMDYLTAADSEAGKLIKKLNEENKLDEGLYTDAELGLIASVGVTSSNDNLLGTTLTAQPITADGYTTSYQWQRDGVAIENATSNTYTTVWEDLGTSITCKVTLTGSDTLEALTSAVVMESSPSFFTYSSLDNSQQTSTATAPEQYVFNVEGTDLVLLEKVFADADDGYFVALKNPVFDTSLYYYDGDVTALAGPIYDATNQSSIAYKVNQESYWDETNDYKNTTYGKKIPDAVRPYLENHRWWTEPVNNTNKSFTYPGSVTTAKVAVMSYAEYRTNKDRYGYRAPFVDKETTVREQVLRSPRYDGTANSASAGNPKLVKISPNVTTASGTYRMSQMTDPAAGATNYGWFQLKPLCFYLDPDFFAEYKFDVANTGADVRTIIKNELGTVANAQAIGYNGYECYLLGFDTADLDAFDYTNVAIEADAETAGKYAISYDLDYVGTDELSYQSIAAVYDEDGVLVAISAPTPVSATTPNKYPVSHTVSGVDDITKCSIKIFAWSDLTTLAPVSPMVFDGTYSELVDPT